MKNNQRGQVSVELILMMCVLLAGALLVSKAFRDEEYFANIVSAPWQNLAGLIQNGVVGKPQNTMDRHPNQYKRFSSPKGDVIE